MKTQSQVKRFLGVTIVVLCGVQPLAAEHQVWTEWHNALQPQGGSSTELTLADNGQTDYCIVIPAVATTQDDKAAEDLQYWLQQITGVQLAIVNEGTPLQGDSPVSIGRTTLLEQSGLPATSVDLGDEGYGIATQGSTLFLWGGRTRGAINAVYALLEEDLGCRWYALALELGDNDGFRIPHMPVLTFAPVERTYKPVLRMRDPSILVALFIHARWSLLNRTNAPWGYISEAWGGHIDYGPLWVHTFQGLVSAGEYFATHPEYFMMDAEGNRQPYAPCTTHPDVLQLVTDKVRQTLAANPNTEIVSVSKNDNHSYCLCPNCRALDDPEGSSMASLLYLVNHVAEQIEPDYPDVLISTLAYFNTTEVPLSVRPRHNVIIRLCNVDSWTLPFTPVEETEFGDLLQEWSAAHDKMSIWDYTVNFHHYLTPMPNMEMIAKNIAFMEANNAVGIMMQGASSSGCRGERDWMRSWVMAKLMWDPSRDWFELIQDFIWGYYGDAAIKVAEYNELLRYQGELYANELRHPSGGIRFSMDHPFLSAEFLNSANAIFDEAELLAENQDILERVECERLPIMYVQLVRGPEFVGAKYGEILDRFDVIARREGISTLRENDHVGLDGRLEEWRADWEAYLENLWQEASVAVDMGVADDEQWLRRVETDGGNTQSVTIEGRDARRNADPSGDAYFYFDVDNLLVYQGNRPQLYITLDYYDTGTGSLTLQYDSNTGDGPSAIYKDGGSVTLTGTNTWRQHVYMISDAYFGNRQDGNADFRIFGGVGNTFYLDIVQLSDEHHVPQIQVDVASFERRVKTGMNLPNDAFTVTNTGEGILTYSIAENANWLSVSPDSGMSTSEPDTFQIIYDTATLAIGEYSAVIEVESSHAVQSPQAITVHLRVFTPGDFDFDGDVDQADFGHFQACLIGPATPQNDPACSGALLDNDSDVDQDDLVIFQGCMSGANVRADPDCAD